jgi:hypothetical protein
MHRRSFPRKRESRLGPRVRGDERVTAEPTKKTPARRRRAGAYSPQGDGIKLRRGELALHDLAADFAAFVRVGVNVGVPEALLQIVGLGVRERRRAFEWAGEILAFL